MPVNHSLLRFPRSVLETNLGGSSIDLEDVGQQLIEDNIVSVSRQMIDKEASVATTTSANNNNNNSTNADGTHYSNHFSGGTMDVDRPEEEL